MKTNPTTSLATAIGCLALVAGSANAALITTGDGLTVTASTFNTGGAGFPPIRTIDGSGLDSGTGVHSDTPGTSWLTPNSDPSAEWIQWDLGNSYTLSSIQVWNVNNNGNLTFGAKSVDIYFSNEAVPGDPEDIGGTDVNWTQLGGSSATIMLPQAPASNNTGFNLATEATFALPTEAVRFVRIEVNTNWAEANTYAGISEIQFDGTLIPEPTSAVLLGLGGLALILRRRK